jgi:hypothetical protein
MDSAYKITDSMEQKPSWEANSNSLSQEILCPLCNLKVHHRVQKGPLLGGSELDECDTQHLSLFL